MADRRSRFHLQPGERLLTAETVRWGTNQTGKPRSGGTLYATDRRLVFGRRSAVATILTVVIGLPVFFMSGIYAGPAGPFIVFVLFFAWHVLKTRIRWLPGQRIGLETALCDVVQFGVEVPPPGIFSNGAVALTMRDGQIWRIGPTGRSGSTEGLARRLRPVLGRDPEPAARETPP